MTSSSTERPEGRNRSLRLVAVLLLGVAALAGPVVAGSTSAVFIDDEAVSATFSTVPDFSAPAANRSTAPASPATATATATAKPPAGPGARPGGEPASSPTPTPAAPGAEENRPRR
ncbi:hypothetical protein [Cellulomonas chengniuliangii]|uniref:Uncharacterized protein n=1 Tax=Cellulomonas chengniuliangii TaxID=2968084 RepID=A0ABY5L207_9CELL|nr:hypothetical protein [Cellulomonas chengniuliangii]MCC2307511.1 hypothetical protein [Cellulomonas chengniuliangii]MCC2318623.1 hypothetical protein [Cellulomonas chengniuliangii]UUI75716.1 hypothetical protein NP064_01995 [Cellulomonas chengniuliangii]